MDRLVLLIYDYASMPMILTQLRHGDGGVGLSLAASV
jgi:hypothetical protein